jgi:hypothetical protein
VIKGANRFNPAAVSKTDCTKQRLLFPDLGTRAVVADFTGGDLSSDGGALLLRQVDQGLGVTRSLARCFLDVRDFRHVDHSVQQLLAQRIYGIALGYEDLNDHDTLRLDPLLATACEKTDPLGKDRFNLAFQGVALAAPSTLNRLELSNNKSTRCHKIQHDPALIQACLLEMGVRCLAKETTEIILDFDAMGHLVHGTQEGRYYSGYYGDYCYLPLYVFAGDIPLWAQLRTADQNAALGALEALQTIVAAIRKRCPNARIIVRADGGFCGENIMAWCEQEREVYYCLGLIKNSVLERLLEPAQAMAQARKCLAGGASVRAFGEFEYQTVKTWTRDRRVIGKAEITSEGYNPRFVVTNLPAEGFAADKDQARFLPQDLYEKIYCGRGQMENVLKQQVMDLEGDRMSTHHMASNQLRLWFSTFAYLLMDRVRALGLVGTELAQATVGSIRLKLMKVAARVTVSVRRVHVQLSSAWAWREVFATCTRKLAGLPLWSG